MAGAVVRRGAEVAGAVRVLQREGLLGGGRPRVAIAMLRETGRIGPLAAVIRRGARLHPDRVAIVDDTGPVTFGELDRGAAALAGKLPDAPVVGVLCRDHRGPVLAIAAAGLAGSRVVLLNTGFAGPQLRGVLEREGVDLVVHDPEFAVDALRTIRTDEFPRTPAAAPLPLPPRPGGLVVLTSGTTGPPKGAPRPKVSPLHSAQVLDRLPFPRGGTVVMAAPVFHATGFSQLTLALASGCTVGLLRRFEAEAAVELVQRTGAQALVVVPTMLHRMLALDPGRVRTGLATLDRIYAGGSALPAGLCERTRELLGDVLHNLYGSTEAGVVAVATPAELALAPGCVGRPPTGVSIRLLGADREPVPQGERGTIFVRSSLAFDRYTDGSGKEVVDGHLATGDLGRIDGHGLLHVDGREDDMIVSGGENVVPGQVEQVLAGHPDVDELVVVGVPDEEFGARLRAVVVRRAGAGCDEAELRRYAREHLSRHEVPREVVFVDALPRNATGKVLRRLLVD